MTAWLLRRLCQAVLVVLMMTVIVFVGLHAIGNAADVLIGQDSDQTADIFDRPNHPYTQALLAEIPRRGAYISWQ